MQVKRTTNLSISLEQLQEYFLLGFVFIYPVFLLINLYDIYELPRLMLLRVSTLVLIFLTFSIWLRRGDCRIKKTGLEKALILFWFIALLTTFSSIHFRTSFYGLKMRYEGFFALSNYILLFYLTAGIIDSKKKSKRLALSFLFSSCLVAVYGILQSFGIEPLEGAVAFMAPGRSNSTFGSPSLTGLFLIFSVMICLGLIFDGSSKKMNILYAAILSLLCWCLFLTYTRSAWIGLFISFTVFMFLLKGRKTKILLFSTALIVLMILTVLSIPFKDRIAENMQLQQLPDRVFIWKTTLKLVADNPFGIGLENFPYYFPKYKPENWGELISEKWRSTDKAHADFLQVSSALGFLGTLGYLWIFVLFITYVFRKVRADIFMSSVLIGAFGYFVGLQFNFTEPSVTPFLPIFCGSVFFWDKSHYRMRVSVSMRKVRSFFYVFFVLAFSYAVFTGYKALFADSRMFWARYWLKSGIPQASVKDSLRAVASDPREDMYHRVLARSYRSYAVRTKNTDYYLEAEKAAKKALEINGYNPLNYLEMGDLYWFGGRYFGPDLEVPKAVGYYKKAIELEPETLNARLGLVEVYEYLGEDDLAIEEAERIIKIDNTREDLKRKIDEIKKRND